MSLPIKIIAFYKFVELGNKQEIQRVLLEKCRQYDIKGTILVAQEGINGTIAGTAQAIDQISAFLRTLTPFSDLTFKESFADFIPFMRMKVRLKEAIVNIGQPAIKPSQAVGEYVPPEAWNALITSPDTLVIDTRNDYEYALGSFKGAINPKTQAFNQLPSYVDNELQGQKHKKIAMFCTGGIRCEKATALLLNQKFEQVYHLQGGILAYLEAIPESDSLWYGECFVFDDRVTVNHQLQKGRYALCAGCDAILSEQDRACVEYEEGVCCGYCIERNVALYQ